MPHVLKCRYKVSGLSLYFVGSLTSRPIKQTIWNTEVRKVTGAIGLMLLFVCGGRMK